MVRKIDGYEHSMPVRLQPPLVYPIPPSDIRHILFVMLSGNLTSKFMIKVFFPKFVSSLGYQMNIQ